MMKNTTNILKYVALVVSVFYFQLSISNAQCLPPGMPGTITGKKTACAYESINYSINAVATATSYTWTMPAGATISGQNPYTTSSLNVTVDYGATFTPPGILSVKANNVCGSSLNRNATITLSIPSQPGNISGSSTPCGGESYTYSITTVNGITNYNWSVTAGMNITSGQGTNSITVSYNAGFGPSGTISVTATNGCNITSIPRNTVVVKRNPPDAPAQITGSDIACPNETHSYSVDPVSGATCNWSIPPGASIVGQGSSTVSITFPSTYTLGNVFCQYVNGCGTSPNSFVTVRAEPKTPGPISGPASGVCNTTQTYSVQPVAGAFSYSWTPPSGAIIVSGQGTNTVNVSFPASFSGQLAVNCTNNCGTSADRLKNITGNIAITQQPINTSACEDDTITISVTVPGGGLSFQWRKDGVNLSDNADFSGTQTPVLSVLKVDSLNAGAYSVVVSSTCAPSVTSSSANFTVNMRPPVPSPISGPAYACPGNTNVPLSVLAGGYNTTSHYWFVGSVAAITSGQGTNAVTVDFYPTPNSGYTIKCWAVNACGLSRDSIKNWIRYSVSTPHITSGPLKVCQGQSSVSYDADPVAGATGYSWSVSPDITIKSGQGTLNLVVDYSSTFTTGQICINASDPCFTSPNWCRTIVHDIPATPGNISGQTYSLCNSTSIYSVAPVTGANSYNWTVPAGASIISGSGTNSIQVDFTGSNGGKVCVSGVGNCVTGASRCLSVLVKPNKPSSITPGSGTICANQQGVSFTCSTVSGASAYSWTVPSGSSIVSGQGTNSIVVNFGNSNGQVGVRAQNACGYSGTKVYQVTFSCRNAIKDSQSNSDEYLSLLSASPNPTKDKIILSYNSPVDEKCEVIFTDLLGKNIMNEFRLVNAGNNHLLFDLSNLNQGIYFVTLKSSAKLQQLRILRD